MNRLHAALAPASLVATFFAAGCSSTIGTSSPADGGAADAALDSPAGSALAFDVRTSAATFTHTDGFSGQTARQAKQGIRRLRIYRDASDPSPVVVFDHGKGFVEAGYVAGDDTLVGSAPIATIPEGHYALARITVTHSRYVVSSTMHSGAAIPGDFDCVQTLSDGVEIDGVVRPQGWYRYTFLTGGQPFPSEGTSAPLPSSPATGGFVMKSDGGETYYELPIDVTIAHTITKDLEVVVEVNMSESFRWEDQQLPGYQAGVYDTTPTTFEPVRRFGANSYVVSYE